MKHPRYGYRKLSVWMVGCCWTVAAGTCKVELRDKTAKARDVTERPRDKNAKVRHLVAGDERLKDVDVRGCAIVAVVINAAVLRLVLLFETWWACHMGSHENALSDCSIRWSTH